ncbi:MAG: ABC1 kinase family protein [Gemmatimonas sp.]|jgi:predicted unusual protein kinase regulating ubiquinone biosynthesis (AarF/ABC1/UbiB family)|uniref:ABC1 kinase family protein n=1 Tax=Gemmatimonas sp. TaxID=1962908 RepID=UPI00391F5890|nr:AarF/UbiB family protein [Gemmatimonadota bacterium]
MPWPDLPRLAVILWRVVPLVLSFFRDQRRWIRWGAPVPRSAAFHERRARAIVHQIATLGPTFVKLAQIFASRADLIPEPYLGALATLTDRVPPVPWPTIRRTLAAAWQADPDTIVQALDPVPLAAGSLGQVHRARYEGRDVVVKVLRPHVDAIVTRDVRLSRAIVNALYARWPHHHVLGFRVVLDEFDRHVREEMDFEREAMQCLRMRERFADEPRLRIPRVETALTRRDVLVLEFLEGTRIDQLDAQIARGLVRPHVLAETLIETYARMMLRDGVFHADPHPGNLLVDAQGRIILLDFGMVIDVPVATRKALFDTILAAIRRDAAGTAQGFSTLGMVAPGTPPETMRDLVAVLLGIAYSEDTTVERARVVADRVIRELYNWPIVLPGELVYFARTAALIEGIGARYDRRFNSIRVASPVMLRLRGELLSALLGDDGKREPLVTMAATLGALTGTAVAFVKRRWQSLGASVATTEPGRGMS